MDNVSYLCGELFDGEKSYSNITIRTTGSVITDIGNLREQQSPNQTIDLSDKLIVPGYIDIQVNGGGGIMFNDEPCVNTVETMINAHRKYGTTSLLPTLITDTSDKMLSAINAVQSAIDSGVKGIIGIHLEGPLLNRLKKGAHDENKMRELNSDLFELLTRLNNGKILITLAPELISSAHLTALTNHENVLVFAGHTNANYDQAISAIEAGVIGFTHLFNAMTPFNSREPGVVGAALDSSGTYFGIIADGHHVHPTSFRLAVNAKVRGYCILVTDAMAVVGSDNNFFYLNGEKIESINNKCVNSAGSLAGSDLNMNQAVINAAEFGKMDFFESVRMASTYPAKLLNLDDQLGYVKKGYKANLTILNKDHSVYGTIIEGQFQTV